MEKKSIPILIVGVLIGLLGFLVTLILLALIPIAMAKHITLAEFLLTMDLAKNDCLGMVLPILPLYGVNLVFSVLLWVSGVGVVLSQEWGRKILIGLGIVDLTWMAGDMAFAHKPFGLSVGIEAVVVLVILILLCLPASKAKFQKG